MGLAGLLLVLLEPEWSARTFICKPYGISEGVSRHAEDHPFGLYVPHPVRAEPAVAESGL